MFYFTFFLWDIISINFLSIITLSIIGKIQLLTPLKFVAQWTGDCMDKISKAEIQFCIHYLQPPESSCTWGSGRRVKGSPQSRVVYIYISSFSLSIFIADKWHQLWGCPLCKEELFLRNRWLKIHQSSYIVLDVFFLVSRVRKKRRQKTCPFAELQLLVWSSYSANVFTK